MKSPGHQHTFDYFLVLHHIDPFTSCAQILCDLKMLSLFSAMIDNAPMKCNGDRDFPRFLLDFAVGISILKDKPDLDDLALAFVSECRESEEVENYAANVTGLVEYRDYKFMGLIYSIFFPLASEDGRLILPLKTFDDVQGVSPFDLAASDLDMGGLVSFALSECDIRRQLGFLRYTENFGIGWYLMDLNGGPQAMETALDMVLSDVGRRLEVTLAENASSSEVMDYILAFEYDPEVSPFRRQEFNNCSLVEAPPDEGEEADQGGNHWLTFRGGL